MDSATRMSIEELTIELERAHAVRKHYESIAVDLGKYGQEIWITKDNGALVVPTNIAALMDLIAELQGKKKVACKSWWLGCAVVIITTFLTAWVVLPRC